jgi:hypothetical protein
MILLKFLKNQIEFKPSHGLINNNQLSNPPIELNQFLYYLWFVVINRSLK